ncbi:hypothetical protein BC937DRAFT_88617 [Endogone sp. FLAS-F59071]|nr:hypothetical protein BC937DRAFT_88617 [Endogone sp. FLAS-F59071]|eukprot:RUS22524.1 hypothetical protein BC937DRAFT_88617 [Endogone sp. FLAS-F59071]
MLALRHERNACGGPVYTVNDHGNGANDDGGHDDRGHGVHGARKVGVGSILENVVDERPHGLNRYRRTESIAFVDLDGVLLRVKKKVWVAPPTPQFRPVQFTMAHTTDPELDVDDEQPDFRALLANTSANAQIIPRRGAKDFGPDGSDKQAELITESRDALITLIKEERKVSSKNVCHGMYSLRTGLTRIDTIRGNYLHNMGHTVAGKITLYPEEALFLVSRGALAAVLEEGEEEAYTTGPLSFQQAWARMVGEDDDWTRRCHRPHRRWCTPGIRS